jgi:hypothetical protein
MTKELQHKSPSELLLYNIKRCKNLRNEEELDVPGLRRMELSHWQSNRLARTHTDLRESKRHKLAIEFFLSDLYGAKDFSRRDSDLERSYPMIITVLPVNAIYAVAMAMELDALSLELDSTLSRILSEELGVNKEADLTEEAYAEAYRRSDNYNQRKYQIELIRILGEDLDIVVSKPFIYAALCLARTPAQLAGFGELQDFLERGFRAFRHMRGAEEFLNTIVSREMRILDRIYARHPQPFNLDIPD